MLDFLVIGGGIAGVSAAARLAEAGTVLLLESEAALAYHASGRSAALFEENYGKPSTVALNAASRAYHEAAGVLSPRGFMLVGTPGEAEAFETDRATMGLDVVTMAEALELLPILDTSRVDRAAWHADAWDIDTDALVQGFAKALRAAGGEIRTKSPVTAIRRSGAGWVVTAGEEIEARQIVNAGGAWADEIARMAGVRPLGLQPFRRSMARIPAPEGHDVARWPMVFGPGEDWYAKPDAGALIVSPAEEDPVDPHDAWAEDLTLAEGLAKWEARVTAPVTRLLSSWAGLRTFAPDRTLVLGPDPTDPAFIWCAGQGGYGMQSAPAASRLLADLVTGRAPELDPGSVAALSAARFR